MDTPDYEEVSFQMNCGQRCLLKGLIRAASQGTVYNSASEKATDVGLKAKNLKSTLNKLFNRKGPGLDGDDDFQPVPILANPTESVAKESLQ